MNDVEKFIEKLEDNAQELGVDHIKEVIACAQGFIPKTKTYDIGGGYKVKVLIHLIEPTVE